jgi:hypothetical protein
MKNRALLMALAAGGVCAATASADPTLLDNAVAAGPAVPMSQVQRMPAVRLDENGYARIDLSQPIEPSFQTNAIGIVWDNEENTTGAIPLGNTHILDNHSFSPGPWANLNGRAITAFAATFCNFGTTVPVATYDVLVTFWDEDDVNFEGFTGAGTPMINPTAVPLANFRIAIANQPPNSFQFFPELLPATPIPVQDGDAGVFISYMVTSTGGTLPRNFGATGNGPTVWATDANPTVGSTLDNWGRDRNNDGIFTGGPIAAAPAEHNVSGNPAFDMMQTLRGDLGGVTLPTPRVNVGCLVDGTTVRTQASDALTWYEVCVNGAVNDDLLSFLDIDTEGSAGNVDIALYDGEGLIVGLGNQLGRDAGDGSGDNAQLTFGIGRRAAVGDGLQYDGRDGELPAGTYFLAVGPAGTLYGPGFNVTPGVESGSGATINFNTNTNGTPAAPSVPPAPTTALLDFLLPFTYGETEVEQANTGATLLATRQVNWAKFSTIGAASSATGTYLDIDPNTPETNAGVNGVYYVFDSSGNLVAFDNASGPGNWPQLSFGSTTPRFRGTNTEAFAGANGDLPEGTYYFAFALTVTEDIVSSTSDRWHVRGTSGSSIPLNAVFFTGTAVAAQCDSIDFNNDGLFPDDNDLVQFLSVLAGGACDNDPNCNDIDFNNDGLFPDDGDLVTFLRVLAGGPCFE